MSLNDFVVLPNSKAKSVKLNARNPQELHMETVNLALESKEMEEKLQRLKENMSKEKEDRGHPSGFKWKSGQCGSLSSNAPTNSTKKNKETRLQQLSAGKVKIRVLKDEPLTVPPQPPAPPPPPPTDVQKTRKNRLRGTCCGQCEVKTAGLMCADCTEHYCIGCFARFHQKGALKLHKMIPIQTDLKTHVSTRDVVSCFQRSTNLNPNPSSKPLHNSAGTSNVMTQKGGRIPEKGTETLPKPMQLDPDSNKVLALNHGGDRKAEKSEEELERRDEREFSTFLFEGEYNEEESARSFQEALRQWRGEKTNRAGENTSEDTMWMPVRPVSVSAMATQADLTPDRGAEGRGRGEGEGRVPVRVEFTENSLTYMDRLLLKKHRRAPVETYRPLLSFGELPDANTQEENVSSLTVQEEDFRHYCASLFAVPDSRGRTELQFPKPESCLVIEVLDERDTQIDGDFAAQRKTDSGRKVPSVQQVFSLGRTLVNQAALITSSGSFTVTHCTTSPTKPQRKPRTAAPSRAVSSPERKPSACLTAETPRTSKTSIKSPTSASQKPSCSPTVCKSKPDCGSPRLFPSPSLPHSLTEFPESSQNSSPFDVSSMADSGPPIPEDHPTPSPSISLSLRSTFTVSPSSSSESALLPKVYQSTCAQKGSDSFLLPEQSSQLIPEPISSLKLSQSHPSNLESPRSSQQSFCYPDSLLSDNQLRLPLSPLSSSPSPPPKSLEPNQPAKILSGEPLFKDSPPDTYLRLGVTHGNVEAPVSVSSPSICGDHESTLSHQDTHWIQSLPFYIIQNPPVRRDEEDDLSTASGDEMSSDSLGVAPHEEDSSDEEAQMHGHVARGQCREEERGNPAISHQEDSFVPADAEGEKDFSG